MYTVYSHKTLIHLSSIVVDDFGNMLYLSAGSVAWDCGWYFVVCGGFEYDN
jgi:hypothetical protein